MWKYKGEELGLEGITGIPARDMTDEEFGEAEAKQAIKFRDQPGSLAKSGLWVHEEDEKPKATSRTTLVTKEDEPKASETPKVDEEKKEGDNNG